MKAGREAGRQGGREAGRQTRKRKRIQNRNDPRVWSPNETLQLLRACSAYSNNRDFGKKKT